MEEGGQEQLLVREEAVLVITYKKCFLITF
jgi:hypothetical protein